jgi:hypothetical protein
MSPNRAGSSITALISITTGTLYQRFCPRFDLRTGTAIQFGATVLVIPIPLAIWLKT